MKKRILSAILVSVIAIGLGTTGYIVYAHGNEQTNNVNTTPPVNQNIESQAESQKLTQGNVDEMEQLMQDQGISVDEMEALMEQYGMNYSDMEQYMAEQGIDIDEMFQLMEGRNFNFGQMKPYIEQMHPNISSDEAKDMYESMHGTSGSSNSSNFIGNMGSFGGMGGMGSR